MNNKIKEITINKDIFERIIISLEKMKDYADDGTIDVNNPEEDYESFAKDIKEAENCILTGHEIIFNK